MALTLFERAVVHTVYKGNSEDAQVLLIHWRLVNALFKKS